MNLEESRPRLPAVTSLRFFAAFHVALFHMNEMGALTGPRWLKSFAGNRLRRGEFLLRAVGIHPGLHLRRPRRSYKRDFYQARFARIYPAYLFSLLISLAVLLSSVPSKMHVPFFAFAEQHFVLASMLVLLLLQAWLPAAALCGTR